MKKIFLAAVFFVGSTASLAFGLRVKDEQVLLDKFDDYELCQSKDYSGDWCHDAMKRWVEKNPADAFKAGKATRRLMNARASMHFFNLAFKAKKGDCKDEDVSLAVTASLDLPAETYKELVEQAQQIGFKTCFKEMKDKIFAEASVGSNVLTNVCRFPDAVAQLPALKKAKCKDLK